MSEVTTNSVEVCSPRFVSSGPQPNVCFNQPLLILHFLHNILIKVILSNISFYSKKQNCKKQISPLDQLHIYYRI